MEDLNDVPLDDDDHIERSPRWKEWRICFGIPVDEESLSEQRQRYMDLLDTHSEAFEIVEPETDEATTMNTTVSSHLDPLSAMIQAQDEQTAREMELERQYRNDRRSRHAHTSDETPDDRAAYNELIRKDLHRLSPDMNEASRLVILHRILMIYSLEHTGGYLQGMHEIASFVLFCTCTEADAYILTECILQHIAAAYDLDERTSLSAQAVRILGRLQPVAPQLYQKLRSIDIPFQLIFTKWIRLLFGRETKEVSLVWDALFHTGVPLQVSAEALAAARLWEHGNRIMVSNDHDDIMHFCMNMPMEDNVTVWIARMRVLLSLDPPDTLPPPKSYGPLPVVQHVTPQPPPRTITSWDPTALMVPPQLSTFTEKLAAQTQHLSKRITQEWENLHHTTAAPPPEPTYNLEYYGDERQCDTATPAPIDRNVSFQERLRRNTTVLQQFSISVEQTAGLRVPAAVWTALSDLEAMERQLPSSWEN